MIQLNLEDGLAIFEDRSFDVVLQLETLQHLRNTEKMLRETARVGRLGIVSFPNFAHWPNRLSVARGRMPVTKALPYEWYDTPNIRVGTYADFEVLARKGGLRILDAFGIQAGRIVRTWPNLRASVAVFKFAKAAIDMNRSGSSAAATAGLSFEVHDTLPSDAGDIVDVGLGAANDAAAPLHEVRALSSFARDAAGAVVGGAIGRTWGECCELQQLWVHDAWRRCGVGSRLVRQFEQRAAQRGCRIFYLETFSFQAPALYRSLGYRVVHEHRGFPHGIVKYLMQREDATPDEAAPPRESGAARRGLAAGAGTAVALRPAR